MRTQLVVAVLFGVMCGVAFGQSQYAVLYSFIGPPTDGTFPNAGLVQHNAKLFGTTYFGGSNCSGDGGCGTVFVMENFYGRAIEAPIYNFCTTGSPATCPDGAFPSAGLTADAEGNLYGTANAGGLPCSDGYLSCGVVFKVFLSGGAWNETVLYSFSGPDGERPTGQLIFDSAGNLYGTTVYGGAYGAGNVFELSPTEGIWTEKTLHDFNSAVGDGAEPYLSGLVFDAAGNLYGTTATGGPTDSNCHFDQYFGCGTVFELSPNTDGTWTESIIHAFGPNQRFPEASLILDAPGNLYGTSSVEGINDGAVFRLSPVAGGWTERAFSFDGLDGANPYAPLTIYKGALYGTSDAGGTSNNGVVFKIQGNAQTVLHNFAGPPNDGLGPFCGGPLLPIQGSLYGATSGGGTHGYGVIFSLTP
jgi:uncharacterized repeat protein (TIGR03803 family)